MMKEKTPTFTLRNLPHQIRPRSQDKAKTMASMCQRWPGPALAWAGRCECGALNGWWFLLSSLKMLSQRRRSFFPVGMGAEREPRIGNLGSHFPRAADEI